MTRSGREKYLSRTLRSLRRQPVDIMVWANGKMDESVFGDVVWSHVHPFNVGQHVAHNAMLDECVKRGYEWHIRVDDDCWITTKTWLKRLMSVQNELIKLNGRAAVLGMRITGLNAPPVAIRAYEIGREIADHVSILGGIFRMSPMSMMRYFRWDERQAMGFGDATQFANFCESVGVAMLRIQGVKATHGDSTERQNALDNSWAHEHDMLQYIPLGL